jgi:hypothetical protein
LCGAALSIPSSGLTRIGGIHQKKNRLPHPRAPITIFRETKRMIQLEDVPDDALQNIASFLPAPDLLQFLSTHRHLVNLSKTESFWRCLSGGKEDLVFDDYEDAKYDYLIKAYVNALPVVEWKPVHSSRKSPTSREGHLCCKLGSKIVITGGFTDDEHVYVLETDEEDEEDDWQKIHPTYQECWRHPQSSRNRPHAELHNNPILDDNEHQPSHVYGATLTPLDETRAVRFG